MKFRCRELVIKSKVYKMYEAIEVPNQLRTLYLPNNVNCILGNAVGYKFLHELFLIAGSMKEENTIFIVYDTSAEIEGFHELYERAEFHKNIMLFNFEKTQVSVKLFSRLLKMNNYVKSYLIELEIPKFDFKKIKYWNLGNTLNIKNYGKWLVISSNYSGYNFMSKEAKSFINIIDDSEEYYAHTHLCPLTNGEDVLDLRYYYQVIKE